MLQLPSGNIKYTKLDKQNFIQILENPNRFELATLKKLKAVVDAHPYFQSARVLYLKALKDLGSFRYNNELKITASYTADRSILFDFITSDTFSKDEISSEEKELIKNKQADKKETKVEKAEKELEIGKPLGFGKTEKHSFAQWLQLSTNKPVDRKENLKEVILEEKQEDKKSLHDSIIEQFIASNPKISRIDKSSSYEVKVAEMEQHPQLMTETLARVYLEQKKYGNAIKAYEILSLKYPEKSGFFADQIKQIRILQNNR